MNKKLEVGSGKLEVTCRRFISTSNVPPLKKFEVRSSKFELTCRRFVPTSTFPLATSSSERKVALRRRFIRTSNFVIRTSYSAAALFLATAASACPVCFGDPSAPAAKGMNAAIWFLLGMVGFVQAGFVALFVTFWRRARALRRRRESLQLIHGGLR